MRPDSFKQRLASGKSKGYEYAEIEIAPGITVSGHDVMVYPECLSLTSEAIKDSLQKAFEVVQDVDWSYHACGGADGIFNGFRGTYSDFKVIKEKIAKDFPTRVKA